MTGSNERIDIRIPLKFLSDIEKYQLEEDISNRTSALLELIRIGLRIGSEVRIKIRGESQRIDIRIPSSLLEKIEAYKVQHGIKTRNATMIELAKIGLNVTKPHFDSSTNLTDE